MGSTFLPYALSTFQSIPSAYGFVISSPSVWHTTAEQINQESGTGIKSGRFISSRGVIEGTALPKRQDTYLSSGTGRKFTVVQGGTTWREGVYHNQFHAPGIEYISRAISTTPANPPEITSDTSTTGIEHAEIIIRKGFPPVADSSIQDQSHKVDNNYLYLELAYNSDDNLNYRIALVYGSPIRLDISYDAGVTWEEGVAIARDLGSVEKYLAANNNEIRFTIKPSYNKVLGVEVGNGNWLTHSPDPKRINPPKNLTNLASSDPLLPSKGRLRLVNRNGWCAIFYFPYRYQDVTVTKKTKRNYGRPVPNAQSAFLVANALEKAESTQGNTYSIDTDGQNFAWSVKATNPDAGDGQGSALPPVISDVTMVIPAVWARAVPGGIPDFRQFNANPIKVVETQVIDDVSRTMMSRAILTCGNYRGEFSGSFGNFAVALDADVGFGTYRRLTGLTDDRDQAWTFRRADPSRTVDIAVTDKSRLLAVGIDEEVTFDNWALCSAVRFLLEKGNIHSSFLDPAFPYYMPPGSTPEAPYGCAAADCPFPILPRGTGNQPRFKYLPGTPIWQILMQLCQDSGDIDPILGTPAPYYMGFTTGGYFVFAAQSFVSRPIVQTYSTIDPSGVGQIQGLEVSNSAGQMRTELHFQSIDALTYELLYSFLPMPSYVLANKAFREVWIERSARWASQEYLEYMIRVASIQASIPQQTVTIKVPFLPHVNAGDSIAIYDDLTLGGGGIYSIRAIQSVYGVRDNGDVDSYSIITAKALVNTI